MDGHLFGVFVVGFFAGRRAKTRRMFFSLNFPLPPPPSKKRLWLVGVFFFFITWPVCFAAAWEQKIKKKTVGRDDRKNNGAMIEKIKEDATHTVGEKQVKIMERRERK